MIEVDTSALMAIVLNDPGAGACVVALEAEDNFLIFCRHDRGGPHCRGPAQCRRGNGALIDGLGFEVVAVMPASAAAYPIHGVPWL